MDSDKNISDDEYILRRIPFHWVRPDGTILEDAYRPEFPRDHNGVSIGFKKKIYSKTKLNSFNLGPKRKTCICQLLVLVPRQHKYDCAYKSDSDKYGLIIGNMNSLFNHIEALIDFSDRSEIIYNHPYDGWLMKPEPVIP